MLKQFKTMMQAAALVGVSATAAQAAAPLKADVVHWWTSGSEAAAVKVFADSYNEAGGQWVDNAVAGSSNGRALAINRMIGGNPPTAAQFNTGQQFSSLISQGLLRDITPLAKQGQWRSFMPASFVDSVAVDGHFYGVPVDVEGNNWMYYSQKVLKDSGVDRVPQTWPDFFAALDKIKAKGYLPLVIGDEMWQQRLLFHSVLLAKGGKDLYMKIYRDKDEAALDSPAFLEVLKTFGKLRTYVKPGDSGRNWNDATTQVMTDKAGFQVMGDWAQGEFKNAGKTLDTDYGCALVPGSDQLLIQGDVFVFPKTKNKQQLAAQDLLAKTFLKPDVQARFAQAKGALPIHGDLAADADACAKKGMAKLKAGETVPLAVLLLSADKNGQLGDIITEFWNNERMSPEKAVKQIKDVMLSDY